MSTADWCLGQSVWTSLHERIRRQSRRNDTDDLLQTALLHLFERGLEGIDHPEAYVLRATRNLAIDRARREKRIGFTSLDDEAGTEPVCASPGPERILLGREQLSRVRKAFAMLDERTARIFLMHRLEGLTYSAIAGKMALSVSTVEKSIARALAHLALALMTERTP
ncbi:RNA polymerase sigma factor [Asaia lannensis]|uniref:RNA polymerase sigma factor n=1 Tax=Asaia lannensis NBRC 102526 TaxID=1307926 RepID=A0ABT1CFP7_9PROT|nr:RNA polymerase sigma factor [Asaia lannensis]MCO6159660.1 RNA polymerase sigma factor [Asaia lannensis NBRC 102526]GBQ98977.1 RNA polymerase sigma-24 factor [Asaia lannensis NBRC 102526]